MFRADNVCVEYIRYIPEKKSVEIYVLTIELKQYAATLLRECKYCTL